MDDLEASRLTEQRYSQQQDTLAQEEELVAILKRFDMGCGDHVDVLAVAAALGIARFFAN